MYSCTKDLLPLPIKGRAISGYGAQEGQDVTPKITGLPCHGKRPFYDAREDQDVTPKTTGFPCHGKRPFYRRTTWPIDPFAQLPGDSYGDNSPSCYGVDFQRPGLDKFGLDGGLNGDTSFGGYRQHGCRDMGSNDETNMLWDGHSEPEVPGLEKNQDDTESRFFSAAPNFTDSVCPVELPKECQSDTSVIFKNVSAASTTQILYELLTKNYKSSITKVREKKFAMTATIFCEVGPCLSHCTMKMQTFRQSRSTNEEGEQGLIIQFRRKKDDVIAFNHIFKQISSELQNRASLLQPGTRAPDNVVANLKEIDLPASPTLPTHPISTERGYDVQPLLDMLVNTAWPAGQVEAMAGVAKLLASADVVSESIIISALSKTPGVYQQLLELGASPEFEINYPARFLVSQLEHYSGGKSTTVL